VITEKPMWSYIHNVESEIFTMFCLYFYVFLLCFVCTWFPKTLTSPTMVLPLVGFFKNIMYVNGVFPV
jgi:hypothetical protein